MNKSAISSWIFLVLSVLSLSSKASARDFGDGFGDVLFDDGSGTLKCSKIESKSGLCLMPLDRAELYCRQQGKRLPTARELAEYAVRHGAQGIIEGSDWGKCTPAIPGRVCIPENYEDWMIVSPVKNSVLGGFYYSAKGYSPPIDFKAGDRSCFWTSSRIQDSFYSRPFVFCHDSYQPEIPGAGHPYKMGQIVTDLEIYGSPGVTCFPK